MATEKPALPEIVCLPRKLAVASFGALSYVARHSTDPKIEEALKQFETALAAELASDYSEALRAENAQLRELLREVMGGTVRHAKIRAALAGSR